MPDMAVQLRARMDRMIAVLLAFCAADRARLNRAAPMNVAKASPSIGHAAFNSALLLNMKPPENSSVPASSDRWLSHATSLGAGSPLPITTGKTCCKAPSMIMLINPSVMPCVAASNAGVCRWDGQRDCLHPLPASAQPAAEREAQLQRSAAARKCAGLALC